MKIGEIDSLRRARELAAIKFGRTKIPHKENKGIKCIRGKGNPY